MKLGQVSERNVNQTNVKQKINDMKEKISKRKNQIATNFSQRVYLTP
ncbi:unnamed protein product [Paramecium pentaurelia]|uniref:Uncharacterized protein n=1 Tax=Paramecium pentaurelia TaxID=43138 RepID=A0A8S1SHF4_9CILI|nr:unnamed protein product [Paramecium pentaurelia]